MSTNDIATKADIAGAMNEIKELLREAMSQVNNPGKRWLRNSEVMEMLGLSASGLQNLRINGTLPYSKLGGTIYYDYASILKILDQNKKNAE